MSDPAKYRTKEELEDYKDKIENSGVNNACFNSQQLLSNCEKDLTEKDV